MKRVVRRTLKRFGLEIRRIETPRTLMGFITDRNIDVVLDVGANVGQFGASLRAQGYRGRIVSYEPISTVYRILAATTASDLEWDIYNFALGLKAESVTINVSVSSEFSSILPSTCAAMKYNDAATVTRTELIEVRKLDDVFPKPSGNTLLKIDTQGYERQVLEGGRSLLPKLKGVLMELPIVHLYQGTWQFHEAIAFMADAGFVPAQIHPVNFHSTDRVSLIEVDCLFRPRDPRMD
jgi:FkbM family methyltransferase